MSAFADWRAQAMFDKSIRTKLLFPNGLRSPYTLRILQTHSYQTLQAILLRVNVITCAVIKISDCIGAVLHVTVADGDDTLHKIKEFTIRVKLDKCP